MKYTNYRIINDTDYPTMLKIEYVGRGSLHKSLRGHYSDKNRCLKAIENYERSKGR